MEKINIAFFDAKPYDIESFDATNKEFGFNIKYFSNRLNADTVFQAAGHNVVCAFVNDDLSKEVIPGLIESGVRLIALRAAGYNNVDLEAVYKKIHVVRVPAYSPYAVAEHAVALMMSLNRKIHRAYYRTRDNNFNINGFLGFDMFGKTAGIIGAGKIGKILAKILRGFGMEVLVFDNNRDNEFESSSGCKYVEIDELYEKSDIISLHCPLTKETHHLINKVSIDKMKNGVMIINTGRGQLIDTKELIEALKDRKVGSAGLDVYEEESDYFFEDFSNSIISDDVLSRILSFPNVIVTSHQAFFTKEALHNIAGTTLKNIKDYFSDGRLENEICYKCSAKQCLKNQGKRCFETEYDKSTLSFK
jgi:D-lactate dehydrogenase